uniref:Phosphatidylinositol glycan, class F n=1 Tax=Gongylonema pulchrum TaxID=637853 RepID=A0A183E2G4_9BILA
LTRKCIISRSISLCGIFGAWLGAIALPLDWDRWWQRWPLPCVFGALLGACCGFLYSASHLIFTWFRGRRRKTTKFV